MSQVGYTGGGCDISVAQSAKIVDDLRELLDLSSKDRLLLLCCGNGAVTSRLAKDVAAVVGVDLMEDHVAVARGNAAELPVHLRYLHRDLRQFAQIPDLDEQPFTRVLLHAGQQHFTPRKFKPLLREILRQCAPDAVIVFGFVPEAGRYGSLLNTWRNQLFHWLGRDESGHSWSRPELELVCADLGLVCTFHPVHDSLLEASDRFNARITRPVQDLKDLEARKAHDVCTEIAAWIASSGVFDAAYYVRCYGEDIPADLSPIDHFLMEGLNRGFKPNATFDPLVCKLRFPRIGSSGVLKHLVGPQQGVGFYTDVHSRLPQVREMSRYRPAFQFPFHDPENVAAAKCYGQKRSIPFEAAERPYRLLVPDAKVWKTRFDKNRPFAFVRITHGDWDALYAFQHYQREIGSTAAAAGLSKEMQDRLAARLCEQKLFNEEIFEENFVCEFLDDMRRRTRSPDFFHAVAFKGYPTADERLFEWCADNSMDLSDLGKLRLFSEFFDPSEPLYDATIWKRWLISGDIAFLPEAARARPVILMGSDRLSGLGDRWQLPWFLHVPIPSAHGYRHRYRLLGECRDAIRDANGIARRQGSGRPLFLLQGSSFAYWFMVRLFEEHPDIFYLDLGQALHPWFYDLREIPLLTWGKIYAPTILENSGLEAYYRSLGTAEPVAQSLFADRLA